MAIRVTGKCPVCLHEVTTDAPRNRVTWRGDCPRDGCRGKILARRSRGDDKPTGTPPASTPPATSTPPAAKRSTVKKVTNANRDPAASVPPTPRPGRPAADGPGRPADDEQQRRTDGEPAGQPPVEPAGRRPARAAAPESGDSGRRPYAHLFPGW